MNRWINLRTLNTDHWSGERMIGVLENKFPNIKFKLGKIRLSSDCRIPTLLVPVMAYLPTPHPNEISREVVLYALNLTEKSGWVEPPIGEEMFR